MFNKRLQESVEVMRQFNRFYTKYIGLLNKSLLKTQFSLIQARIIFEIAQRQKLTASMLCRELNIDPGYLSRILDTFEKKGLIIRTKSDSDSRQRFLKLSKAGENAYSVLNQRSAKETEAKLEILSVSEQNLIIESMKKIQQILGGGTQLAKPFLLRQLRTGDLGWIIHRHGSLYAEEYGFDQSFETLVADILLKFINKHDPRREMIWIAEQDGKPLGSIMVVDAGDNMAQLRLLLVEPDERGKGLGNLLIEECIKFARRAKYKRIKLWTQSMLVEARSLYKKAGFQVVNKKAISSFGHDLISEIWELSL